MPSGPLSLYIDGADEATADGVLIKGGGAALTREKVVAAASATIRLHHRRQQAGRGAGQAFPSPSR